MLRTPSSCSNVAIGLKQPLSHTRCCAKAAAARWGLAEQQQQHLQHQQPATVPRLHALLQLPRCNSRSAIVTSASSQASGHDKPSNGESKEKPSKQETKASKQRAAQQSHVAAPKLPSKQAKVRPSAGVETVAAAGVLEDGPATAGSTGTAAAAPGAAAPADAPAAQPAQELENVSDIAHEPSSLPSRQQSSDPATPTFERSVFDAAAAAKPARKHPASDALPAAADAGAGVDAGSEVPVTPPAAAAAGPRARSSRRSRQTITEVQVAASPVSAAHTAAQSSADSSASRTTSVDNVQDAASTEGSHVQEAAAEPPGLQAAVAADTARRSAQVPNEAEAEHGQVELVFGVRGAPAFTTLQLDTVKKVLKLVYSRGIDKKLFLKAADKALVDLDKSGEPQGVVFYLKDGTACDTLSKLKKRLSQDGPLSVSSRLASAGKLPSDASRSGRSKRKAFEELDTIIAPVLDSLQVPPSVLQLLREHVEQGGSLNHGSVGLAKLCVQVQRFCPLSSPRGCYTGLLTSLAGIAWVLNRTTLPLYNPNVPEFNTELRLRHGVGLTDLQIPAAGCNAAEAFEALVGQSSISRRAQAVTNSLSFIADCPWLQLSKSTNGAAADGGTTYTGSITWNTFLNNFNRQDESAAQQLVSDLQKAILQHHGLREKPKQLAALLGAALQHQLAAKPSAKDAGTSKIDPSTIVPGVAAYQALEDVRNTCEGQSVPGRLVWALSVGLAIDQGHLVSLVCDSCPELIGSTNKKQKKRELSAAIHTLLSQHGRGLWVDTGVQQPRWKFHLNKVLQSQQQARDALFQFMPALAPRVLDPQQASVAGYVADMSSSTAPVGLGTAVAGDSKGNSSSSDSGSAASTSGSGKIVSSNGSVSADSTSSSAPSRISQPAAAKEAMLQPSTSVPVPMAPRMAKLAATAALEYVGVLPGFADLEVVEVGAAYSAASERMLQHMRCASLIGADIEPAIGPDGERRCAVISFMVPAAASRRKGEGSVSWPDTVYIVDLVAAGLVSYDHAVGTTTVQQSPLMQGIAAVLRNPNILVAMNDCNWDAAVLSQDCGVDVRAIDTQVCWMLLVAAGVKEDEKGSSIRRSLEFQLEQYGLVHPNKNNYKQLNRGVPLGGERGRFLVAPRPLPAELLEYAASDVRYLPALVMLMERDLLRANPGAFMQQLQEVKLKATRKGRDSGKYLGATLRQLLAGWLGPVTVLPPAQTAEPPTGAHNTASSSSYCCSSSGGRPDSGSSSATRSEPWTIPDMFDTRVSSLAFVVQLPSAPVSLQQLADIRFVQADYQLVVTSGALADAQAAAIETSKQPALWLWQQDRHNSVAIAGGGMVSQQQQQQQQQHRQQKRGQQLQQPVGSGWQPDEASQQVLALLGARLASQLQEDISAKVEQLSQRYDASSLQRLQLQDVVVLPEGALRYCLGTDGVALAEPANSSSSTGSSSNEGGRFRRFFRLTLAEGTAECLSACLEQVAEKNGWPVDTAAAELLNRSHTWQPVKGTLHMMAPVLHHSPQSSASSISGNALGASTPAAAADNSETPAAKAAAAANKALIGLHFIVWRTQPGLSLVLGDSLAAIAAAAHGYLPAHLQPPGTSSSSSRSSSDGLTTQVLQEKKGKGLDAWNVGLEPFVVPTPTAAAAANTAVSSVHGNPSALLDTVPGHLLLLFGPRQSGKTSLLWDAADQLSTGWSCNVAVIDSEGSPRFPTSCALHLPANSPDAQAAAITAAWQQHGCRVVVCEHIDASPAVVQAVQAALAAGCSVAAAAQGVASLAGAAGRAAAAAAAAVEDSRQVDSSVLSTYDSKCTVDNSSSSIQESAPQGTGEGCVDVQPAMQQQHQQQGQCGVIELWSLLLQLAQQHAGGCTVVDCHRNYRWHIHCNLQQTLKILQQASEQSTHPEGAQQLTGVGRSLSSAAAAYVLPVEVRELVPAQGRAGVLARAAAVIDGSGILHSHLQSPAQQAQQEDGKGDVMQSSRQRRRQKASQVQAAEQQDGSTSADDSAEVNHAVSEHAGMLGTTVGPVVVGRFSTYGAAAAVLPGGLQECVRRLLHPASNG